MDINMVLNVKKKKKVIYVSVKENNYILFIINNIHTFL